MFGNDRLGDCTIAAAAHMTQLWTAMSGRPALPTETMVEKMYYAIGRTENPGQQKPDNGLVELDVLNYWRKHGIASERAFAFAKVDRLHFDAVKHAIMLFGGCYIGFGISDAAQTFREFNARQPWTPQPGTPTEGHAVNLVGYDADGITCVSYVRLFEQKWKIRPAPSKPDPDGYSFDAVIGGRE
jgi:hypothetical protein